MKLWKYNKDLLLGKKGLINMNEFKGRKLEIQKPKGKMVQHFKGKYYLILDFARHIETGEILIIML